jgi:hypothetical protein
VEELGGKENKTRGIRVRLGLRLGLGLGLGRVGRERKLSKRNQSE